MNKSNPKTLIRHYINIALWLCLWCLPIQCLTESPSKSPPASLVKLEMLASFPITPLRPQKIKTFKRRGKLINEPTLAQAYNKTNLSNFNLPLIDEEYMGALQQQLKLLKRRKQDFTQKFSNISLNLTDLETTVELLMLWQESYPQSLAEHLDAYQLDGLDGIGNVKFTGYFTPEIKVSKQKNKNYQYPLFSYPKKWEGPMPTREEIDGQNALAGRGLELAYTQKLEDIYYMQLQGSGLVGYPNGHFSYFGYAGSNRHGYKSIGQFIKDNEAIPLRNISMNGIKNYLKFHPEMVEPILFSNPSYVFFEESSSLPLGAGHVPLTPDYSIAVDTRHLPLGSCLLAAMPVLNEKGKFSHHQYKFVVAQDVGGAIRGNGHVDVYCGVGEEGERKAMALHHYGQLWLLLPKPSEELGPVFSDESWADQ